MHLKSYLKLSYFIYNFYLCLYTKPRQRSVQFEYRENIVKKYLIVSSQCTCYKKFLTLLTANLYPIHINKINMQSWHVGLEVAECLSQAC